MGTITTPSVSTKYDVSDYRFHSFLYTVSNINTNVVMRIEGSIDGTNFVNINDSDLDTTITSNTTVLDHKPTFKIKYLRAKMVSKSSVNSTPSVIVYYMGGN
jgi:hypothetical protein